MVGREDAAGHAIGDDRDAGGVGERAGRGIGSVCPDIAAQDEDGALGCAQQSGNVREIRLEMQGRRCGDGRSRHRGREKHVHGDIDKDGPSVSGPGCGEGCVHGGPHLGGVVDRGGGLGHGSKQRRMVDLLQRP